MNQIEVKREGKPMLEVEQVITLDMLQDFLGSNVDKRVLENLSAHLDDAKKAQLSFITMNDTQLTLHFKYDGPISVALKGHEEEMQARKFKKGVM